MEPPLPPHSLLTVSHDTDKILWEIEKLSNSDILFDIIGLPNFAGIMTYYSA